MVDTEEMSPAATPLWKERTTARWLTSAGLLSIGLILGGFLLGDGLVRAKDADRSVTVRGLAEREVTADLAHKQRRTGPESGQATG